MLNENHITDILVTYLINEGHEIVSKLTTTQRGIDLIVKYKNNVTTYIEVKGETSSRVGSNRHGKPFDNKQITNHIGRALLASFKAMNIYTSETDRFAIAFPDTMEHQKELNKIKSVLGKVNIIIYLVADTGVRIL